MKFVILFLFQRISFSKEEKTKDGKEKRKFNANQFSAWLVSGSRGRVDGGDCSDVPEMCTRHNAVYHIFHYLTDAEFLVDGNHQLRYAAVFLPTARSTALLPYFHWLDGLWPLADNWTVTVAMDFGLKETLFNEYMVRDVLFLSVGGVLVCTLMWWYTTSVFLTFMAILSVVLSLAVAYFVYTFVFELDFFPFMNLLAAVIVVGIGADDVFVYIQVDSFVFIVLFPSTPLANFRSFK